MLSACIYCGDTDGPRADEHVLQAAFGGGAVLTEDVCAKCNHALSVIDGRLAEFVRAFVLGKVIRLISQGRFSPGMDEPTVIARLDRGLGVPVSQLIEHQGAWQLIGTSEEEAEKMLAELASPGSAVTSTVEPDGPLRIVRSALRKYRVIGPTSEQAESLANQLRQSGLLVTWRGPVTITPERHARAGDEIPPLKFNFSFDLKSASRALAKVALNFVCRRLGGNTARHASLDPLRSFARYGQGRWTDFVQLRVLDHSLDEAFGSYCADQTHALVLQSINGHAAVLVVLYGQVIGLIRLTGHEPAATCIPASTWLVSYFRNGSAEHLRVPDDGLRCFVNMAAPVKDDVEEVDE